MAHRYWQILFPNSPTGGPGFLGNVGACATGIEMRATIGGANLIGSGGAFASTEQAGSDAAKGFLPYSGDRRWQTQFHNYPTTFPATIGYDFGAGNDVDVAEIAITGVLGSFGATMCRRVALGWSDSGDPDEFTYQYFWQTPLPWATDGSDVRVFNSLNAMENLPVWQARALTLYNYPTEQIQATQMRGLSGFQQTADIRVNYARVMSLVRGRTKDPRVRAWTFSLDGHDFYVLRLGDTVTLVYDCYSEQWVDWDTLGLTILRVNTGINWVGGSRLAPFYGSNIVLGDDTSGTLWVFNPEKPFDDHPNPLTTSPLYFPRVTMGQLPLTGRTSLPCYAAWLTTDMGDPAYDGAGVTLEFSDDAGKSFFSAGAVEITSGVNMPQLSWYSLGQIEAPGRLFRISDDGAVARIDGMEMNDPDDDG